MSGCLVYEIRHLKKFSFLVSNMAEFEIEVMKYLKNIVNKLILLGDKVKAMETHTVELGRGCSRAFEMCKVVINELTEHQQQLNDTIDEHTGTMTTWIV